MRKLFGTLDPQFTVKHGGQEFPFWGIVIELGLIKTSEARQRRFRRSWCNEIKENFDPRKVRITVSVRPDGTYWIVGGQHCCTAALELGYTRWLVTIVSSKDYQDETDLYDGLNRAKPPSTTDRTKILFERQDPKLLDIIRILKDESFIYDPDKCDWNCFQDPCHLIELFDQHGEEHLKAVLRFVRFAWDGKKRAVLVQNVYGISVLLRLWAQPSGKFPLSDAIRTVSLIEPKNLGTLVSNEPYWRGGDRMARAHCIARFIAERMNKGRGGCKLIFIG